MMLEVGEPGELPLMRELTAPKKSKGGHNSSKKSPLLESLSPNTLEGVFMHPLEDEGRPIREHHDKEYSQEYDSHRGIRGGLHAGYIDPGTCSRRDGAKGASCQSARSPQSTQKFDPTNIRSPPMNDFNARIMNWDVRGVDATYACSDRASTDRLQQESLHSHLEKLGILGEGRSGSDMHMVGETSLLHNWRNAWANDDDGGSLAMHESFQLEPPLHAPWNLHEFSRDDTASRNRMDDFFAYKDEQERRENMRKAVSRQTIGDRLRRPNVQTLSPLMLNPHDENQTFGHANHPIFALDEEPSANDDDDDDEEEHDMVENQAQRGKVFYRSEVSRASINRGSRSGSPLRPHRKQQFATNNTRTFEMYSPPFVFPQGLRPGTSETEFLEYDVEALEQPSKSGRLYQRPMNHKQSVKGHSFTQENVRFSADSMKSMKRKTGSGHERRPVLQRHELKSAQAFNFRRPEVEPLPFLTELEDYNGSDEYGGSSNDGDFGELSMSELPVEACRKGQNSGRLVVTGDGAERLQLAVADCKELALCEYRPRNLSQKYRPKAFEEVVGQHIVTQALSNAILKGRIAPVYLFQGSRGTGKTSAARIFASALLCMSTDGQRRPCGTCRECISVATGKSSEVKEVDAASNNGIERVKALLEETMSAPPLSRYKVFIIDECHVLTTETWNALLKVLEEPPMNVVFILVTTDADGLPRTALSRCQKFPFPKIKDSEIVKRLQKLASMENLSIDLEILQLIASRSDGSLRDAEATLDQVTLLGQQVNPSTVHELVGCASDERMLSLLDAALVADTINTVRRARELVDSGMEPLSLMSRLATLITDILAGTFKFTDNQRKGFFRKQAFSEEKLERLRMAMKILSEAEKQLRVSNDRTTWLTAALLQLGPDRMCMFSASCEGTSVTQSPVALDDIGENEAFDFDHRSTERRTVWTDHNANHAQDFSSKVAPLDGDGGHRDCVYAHENSHWTNKISQDHQQGKVHVEQEFMEADASHERSQGSENSHFEDDPLDISFKDSTNEQRLSPTKLDDIWNKVMERCRSLPLQRMLYASVKLTGISITEVDATIHLEVCHPAHKSSCERSHKSIANLFELVLGFPVEIKTSLASLPAEGEQLRSAQGSSSRVEKIELPGNHIHIHPQAPAPQVYDWRKQERISMSHIPHQSHPTESFPAIPSGTPPKENQRFDNVASTWKNVMCTDSAGRTGNQNATTHIGSQEEKATSIQDPRGLSPMKMPASGGTTAYRTQGQDHRHAVGDSNAYMQSQVYDDINSEEPGMVDETEAFSPNSFEVTDLHDKSRLRQSAYKDPKNTQPLQCIDGRRSCDAEEGKQKGSNLKMIRRLSMRNDALSSPKSDPNTPDEKGSYLRAPRFSTKSHTNPQKHKDSRAPKEACEEPEGAVATQKKGRLKGAAGSFARFFQGKVTK